MDNAYVNNIRKEVKKMLGTDNKSRYHHTIGVADTAACLAMRYGVDMQKAYIAGLLHDCAKCIPDQELLDICCSVNIPVTEAEENSPYLLHGKVGAYYAKTKFHIEDEDILSAIAYHTTGKPSMSALDEILFIADYIEPRRDKAPNLEDIRRITFIDIKQGIYQVCRDTIEYLKAKNQPIDKTTIDTYDSYRRIITGEE